ncbi:MAG: choice-of-anchor D domain-containing protein [Actinomycetota bacterium]
MSQKKSFWGSLPGFMTGLAGIITAALGVVGVLNANSGQPGDSPSAPSPSGSPSRQAGRAGASLSPTELSFGSEAVVASSDTLTLTLTNTGEKKLNVEGADLGGSDASQFQIVEDECSKEQSVPAEGECRIDLRFAPSSVGNFRAKLTIRHNAGGSPSEAVLTGEGVLLKV